MNFPGTLLLASLISVPLAACGDDGGGTTSDASTGNATPATTTNTTTTMDPTAATEPETTAPTTGPGTTGPTTTDGTTTDPATTDGTTTDPGTTTGGDTTGGDTTGGMGLSWAADVYPVLNPPLMCDCHTPGSGGLKMGDVDTAYMNLVDVLSTEAPLDRIEPGDASMSYLWHKINGTHIEAGGSGNKMPLGAPELPQEIRDLIELWIKGGAQP